MTAIPSKQVIRQLRRADAGSQLAPLFEARGAKTLTLDSLDETVRAYRALGGELSPAEVKALGQIQTVLGARSLFETRDDSGALGLHVQSLKPVKRPDRRQSFGDEAPPFSSFLGSRRLTEATLPPGRAWSIAAPSNGAMSCPVLTPDSSKVLFQGAAGNVLLVDRVSGAVEWELQAGKYGYSTPAVSTDGRVAFVAVAQGEGGELWRLSLDTREVTWKTPLPGQGGVQNMVPSPALSPDGKSVFLVGSAGVLQRIDAESGEVRWKHQLDSTTGNLFAGTEVSADGTQVFHKDEDGRLFAFDAESGAILWKSTKMDTGTCNTSGKITPDGRLLLYPSGPYLYAFDTQTGEQVWQRMVGPLSGIERPVFSRDGRKVFLCTGAGLRQLDVEDESQDLLIELRNGVALRHAPVLTADERAAYVMDATGVLSRIDFDTGEAQLILRTAPSSPGTSGFSMSSDGRWLLYGGLDHQLHCREVEA